VIAGDHHDLGVRQRVPKHAELLVGLDDRGVRWANLMENVARNHDEFRRDLDYLGDRAPERLRHVELALIDAARSDPLVLAVTEVEIREMNETQRQ
jgi:hypothetical protein